MSTTDHRPNTAGSARSRAHQRQLLNLLVNRDLLVQTLRLAPISDDEDATGLLHLLTAIETEIEEHFPDIYARELPHWLLTEAGMSTERSLPRCPLCREVSQARKHTRA